jgi:glycosyltransferase involved in cell wall biosynthesis
MIAPLERRLLERVDVLVATAKSLTRSKYPASGRAHHLPQGVNYEHFATPRPEPEDMKAIPRPRIGYAGRVGGCCDLGLVSRVADAYPSASIVLVGKVTADQTTEATLRARRNVHLLGLRPYIDLPAYVQAFDVGIIPYVLSDWTRAVDPLKLLEYLAAGLPVVASAIPEIEKYANTVAMAPNDDAFVRAIGEALRGDRDAARVRGQATARENTWQQRAQVLLDIIREVIEARAATPPRAT